MSRYKEVVKIITEENVWSDSVKIALEEYMKSNSPDPGAESIEVANKIANAFKERFGE